MNIRINLKVNCTSARNENETIKLLNNYMLLLNEFVSGVSGQSIETTINFKK